MPEPARRDAFRHWQPITTRWGDNDVYGHVNNVDFYAFFDTVVNTFLIREGGLDIHAGDRIGLCVSSGCDFHAPLAFPDAIEGGLRVERLGSSSVRYAIGIFAQGADRAAADGHFTHVFVDREDRRPREIPPPLRTALERIAT